MGILGCPHTKNNAYLHAYVFYGSVYSFELLKSSKFASDLKQRSLVRAWKGYHLNGAHIPKPKKPHVWTW